MRRQYQHYRKHLEVSFYPGSFHCLHKFLPGGLCFAEDFVFSSSCWLPRMTGGLNTFNNSLKNTNQNIIYKNTVCVPIFF